MAFQYGRKPCCYLVLSSKSLLSKSSLSSSNSRTIFMIESSASFLCRSCWFSPIRLLLVVRIKRLSPISLSCLCAILECDGLRFVLWAASCFFDKFSTAAFVAELWAIGKFSTAAFLQNCEQCPVICNLLGTTRINVLIYWNATLKCHWDCSFSFFAYYSTPKGLACAGYHKVADEQSRS